MARIYELHPPAGSTHCEGAGTPAEIASDNGKRRWWRCSRCRVVGWDTKVTVTGYKPGYHTRPVEPADAEIPGQLALEV